MEILERIEKRLINIENYLRQEEELYEEYIDDYESYDGEDKEKNKTIQDVYRGYFRINEKNN
ncbi:MAG: hypothetical protein ACK4YO_00620 [Candidatus Altarchaeaceae archaeon]